MKITSVMLAVCCASVMTCGAVAKPSNNRLLIAAEIKRLVVGHFILSGKTIPPMSEMFFADGVTYQLNSDLAPIPGTYRVEGGRLCVSKRSSQAICRQIRKSKNGDIYQKIDGRSQSELIKLEPIRG